MPLAYLFYPAMQAADIFNQNINLAHAGMDQRKAHVIAREVGLKLREPLKHKGKAYKPIAIHHHLLKGLQKPQQAKGESKEEQVISMKMSKSIKGSAVYVHDSPEEIKEKINKAYCPEEVEENPILDWAKHLLFKEPVIINRPEKFGGRLKFETYQDLENSFIKKELHPMDLKNGIAEELIKLLEPARKHFEKGKNKKLLEEIQNITVTR